MQQTHTHTRRALGVPHGGARGAPVVVCFAYICTVCIHTRQLIIYNNHFLIVSGPEAGGGCIYIWCPQNIGVWNSVSQDTGAEESQNTGLEFRVSRHTSMWIYGSAKMSRIWVSRRLGCLSYGNLLKNRLPNIQPLFKISEANIQNSCEPKASTQIIDVYIYIYICWKYSSHGVYMFVTVLVWLFCIKSNFQCIDSPYPFNLPSSRLMCMSTHSKCLESEPFFLRVCQMLVCQAGQRTGTRGHRSS